MVDVARNNRPTAGHFTADKFGSDEFGRAGAEAIAAQALLTFALHRIKLFDTLFLKGPLLIFADSNIFHFRRDDAATSVVHLGDVSPGPSTPRFVLRKRKFALQFDQRAMRMFRTDFSVLARFDPFGS